jgi:hypothetical protein
MFQDKRGYWYRSKRIGERVTREYVGHGTAAAKVSERESTERAEADSQRANEAREREKWDAIDKQFQLDFDTVTVIMQAALEGAGYRQHARGQWRKRRDT